ncbi:MAG: acyl carrier protein [Magnetococcales bacterium]|nr:acyl carrier protein [Magnetococcales bacterium]
MTKEKILNDLSTIFKDLFYYEEDLTLETTPKDVDNWDSLSNIRLFITVEQTYSIRFERFEIGEIESVGALIDFILKKLEKA